ncbi:hypothetical protein T11_5043 [Trichinella zimbabwensis]|uniref:Uncharacterized protein n=1 Tax=Trichinella zimbabwensis TaxID=268475 RepID=A0A0V1G7F7_9BILA|nr:hypothetical protein T11_5043 [Trichinella zimbabwensis]
MNSNLIGAMKIHMHCQIQPMKTIGEYENDLVI